jgi:pduQ protein, putative
VDDFNAHKREIAEAALLDKCTITNPRVPTVEELLKVLEQAF